MRVWEVAKVIGWKSRELVDWLQVQGYAEVTSHTSKLSEEAARDVMRQLEPDSDEMLSGGNTPGEEAQVAPGELMHGAAKNREMEVSSPPPLNRVEVDVSEATPNEEPEPIKPLPSKKYQLVGKASVRVGRQKFTPGDVIKGKDYLALPERVRGFFREYGGDDQRPRTTDHRYLRQ